MKENKFSYGDKVKVINVGGVFSTYHEMAETMDLKNWNENERPKNNSIAHIVNVQQHPSFNETIIYGIKTEDGKNYIMSEYALEKVKPVKKSKNETYSIKLKDMVELFTSYDKKAELLNEINPSDVIKISRNQLKELEKISGNILKSWIRKNHPECFPKPEFDFSEYNKKYGSIIFSKEQYKLLGFKESPIQIRNHGEYHNKGFYLTREVEWKLIKEGNAQLLVPIKK